MKNKIIDGTINTIPAPLGVGLTCKSLSFGFDNRYVFNFGIAYSKNNELKRKLIVIKNIISIMIYKILCCQSYQGNLTKTHDIYI